MWVIEIIVVQKCTIFVGFVLLLIVLIVIRVFSTTDTPDTPLSGGVST